MRKMAKSVRELRGQGRLQVVKNWGHIEAGILKGKKFTAKGFAKYLQERVEHLEYEERLRKEEDKKDDDDEEEDKDD